LVVIRERERERLRGGKGSKSGWWREEVAAAAGIRASAGAAGASPDHLSTDERSLSSFFSSLHTHTSSLSLARAHTQALKTPPR
jgi:hypothetical protein